MQQSEFYNSSYKRHFELYWRKNTWNGIKANFPAIMKRDDFFFEISRSFCKDLIISDIKYNRDNEQISYGRLFHRTCNLFSSLIKFFCRMVLDTEKPRWGGFWTNFQFSEFYAIIANLVHHVEQILFFLDKHIKA